MRFDLLTFVCDVPSGIYFFGVCAVTPMERQYSLFHIGLDTTAKSWTVDLFWLTSLIKW